MDTATDEHAISAVMDGLVEAWRLHDADAYGAHFTEDATYTTFAGTRYTGRADIVESHRILFATFVKGTWLAHEIAAIRFHGPGTAVVTGRGDTCKGKRAKKLRKVQTYLLVRESDGQWRIAAFHNTRKRPLMERLSFMAAPGLAPDSRRSPQEVSPT